jgi:hypothetical protein
MKTSARFASIAAVCATLLLAGVVLGSVINVATHSGDGQDQAVAGRSGSPSSGEVIVGEAAGTVLPATEPATPEATPAPTDTPTEAPTPTESPTSEPTPSPTDESRQTSDGFKAKVMVCTSVSGSHCRGETDVISHDARTIWMLVSFENAAAGDRIGMRLAGEGVTRDGGDYAVKGGDGRAWSQVQGNLPRGRYTVSALRNGEVVAETELRVE